jgi:hypothetical protein
MPSPQVRKLRKKSEKFHKNIEKRGNVSVGTKKESSLAVGPVVIGFFLFVVVGSALLQIIRAAV